MQLYMSWYIINIFWLYLYFLNILYFFKYSCTNIFHRRCLCTFHQIIPATFQSGDRKIVLIVQCSTPGEGTPSMLGDMDVPPFWPPFLTFWGLNLIFLGYFFSSTNTKTIFWGIKTTNSYRIRSFRPQISFFPRSFWVQFSAASGTPPSVFGPSTPPGVLPKVFFLDTRPSNKWLMKFTRPNERFTRLKFQ